MFLNVFDYLNHKISEKKNSYKTIQLDTDCDI